MDENPSCFHIREHVDVVAADVRNSPLAAVPGLCTWLPWLSPTERAMASALVLDDQGAVFASWDTFDQKSEARVHAFFQQVRCRRALGRSI